MSTNLVRPTASMRQYSGGQNKAEPKFRMRQGFDEVNYLYMEYTNFPQRSSYWMFKKKVVMLAAKIFNSYGDMNWFLVQDLNASLHAQNINFIKDTLRFLATGRRRISIHSWPMLITSEYASGVHEDRSIGIRGIFLELGLDTTKTNNDLIQLWLSHPGGFDDLMFSLNMLFGNQPEKITG